MSSLLKTQPFGCTQLEALFRHQLLHRSAGDLLKLLTILVPIQLALALFRVPEPGPSLFWLSGSASVGLGKRVY
ncbi:unnamed protein product [Meloidogyne enterolobii]|uniref:Uncharacterized protein n=1 Tax=Meloidogyne enterolobii TaxID=390850 RepID=A0ACB1AMD9_MELEN